MEQVFLHDIRKEIILRLSEAKQSVCLAMAWFTNQDLFDVLLASLNRGVAVQVIILDDEINRNDSFGLDFNTFIEAGGKLYLFDPKVKLMHHKFCIIDSQILITGSYNWTNYAENRNLENIIVTDNSSVISSYSDGFVDIKNMTRESLHYSRIPASIISKESYSGNYSDYLQEYNYSQRSTNCVSLTAGPRVVEVNNRHNPRTKYNIGFHAYVDHDVNGMRVLIPQNTELPYSIIKDAWLNEDNITNISCEIYYGDDDHSISKNTELVTLPLAIPSSKKNELHFKTKATMDTNGYLHVEFVCVETGKSAETTVCKDELINYD